MHKLVAGGEKYGTRGFGWVRRLRGMVLISLLAMPALVLAANGGGAMAEMPSLSQRMMMLAIQLGVILVAARIGSQIFEHFNLPGVLGELCIGILIGPSLLGGIPIPWSQTFSQGLFHVSPLLGSGTTPVSPELYGIVERLAENAGLPMPKVLPLVISILARGERGGFAAFEF